VFLPSQLFAESGAFLPNQFLLGQLNADEGRYCRVSFAESVFADKAT